MFQCPGIFRYTSDMDDGLPPLSGWGYRYQNFVVAVDDVVDDVVVVVVVVVVVADTVVADTVVGNVVVVVVVVGVVGNHVAVDVADVNRTLPD